MKQFNPSTEQAIEIVRRWCDKYPQFATKIKDYNKLADKKSDLYQLKIKDKVNDNCIIDVSFNNSNYKLILSSYYTNESNILTRYIVRLPINKEQYKELSVMFDHAIYTNILNDMRELDFYDDYIESMFTDEQENQINQ